MKNRIPAVLLADRWVYFTVLCLSAAAFLFEITLTRLFAIAHFYHFAFMVVSLALLGSGAAGSFLSLFPFMHADNLHRVLPVLCAGTALSILGGYLFFNRIPFDSYAVAVDPRQIALFLLQVLVLSMPFFFTGLCVNGLMKAYPQLTGRIYAVNLAGSALGCLPAPLLLPVLAGDGVVCLCILLAALPGLAAAIFSGEKPDDWSFFEFLRYLGILFVCAAVSVTAIPNLADRLRGESGEALFALELSPYKSLSYALRYPGAEVVSAQWNAFSRVDAVQSRGIRSLPGLSYLYPGLAAAGVGLFVDGDNLSPVLSADENADIYLYLPQSLVYALRPSAKVLVLEPRGGLDILAAHAGGASSVTAVEPNPLLVQPAQDIYGLPGTVLAVESPRSFLRRSRGAYDVIVISLTGGYHPVTSGAYSLAENYTYTLGSFEDTLKNLKPDGLLVLNRWLQVPPSEFLRAFTLAVDALENEGLDPAGQIAALRGYNLGTLVVKRKPFQADELQAIRAFCEQRAFDLVYLPGLQPGETNRFNILPQDDYSKSFSGYLAAADRKAWLAAYPYDVSPPTDDRPFFEHYFRWSQMRSLLAEYGKTWQPFGGAGYLVVVFLLLAALFFSAVLILLPILIRLREKPQILRLQGGSGRGRAFAYFLLLGMGYMAIEIPLIQKFILDLGQPTYSFSVVLFTVLLASGLGSMFSGRIDGRWMLVLGALACLSPLWLAALMRVSMGWELAYRLSTVVLFLFPLGFLMGIPFPKGIAAVQACNPERIPWLWAVNGAASVVASVLAAMLTISFGFTPLLIGGGCCYLAAYALLRKM